MNIMTTIGNFLIYSARSPENNPNVNTIKFLTFGNDHFQFWFFF